MASRTRLWISFSSIALAAAAVPLLVPRLAVAQNASAGVQSAAEIENGQYVFVGETRADGTRLQSGTGDNDYPVVRLTKGTKLTVVGMKDEWLKVEPSADVFCLVPQAFVDKFGSGNRGRVVNSPATVRIGSAIVPTAKWKAPLQLPIGTEVQILGAEDEYYKIVPPKGVYVYVNKNAVDPVSRVNGPANPAPANGGGGLTNNAVPNNPPTNNPPTNNVAPTPDGGASAPATTPDGAAGGTQGNPGAGRPDRFISRSTTNPSDEATSQPVASSDKIRELQEELVKVEDRYAAASKQDIAEQPVDALLADYRKLLDDPALPPNARRVAEFRVQTLEVRKDAADQLAATKKMQAEAAERQAKLEAERQELQQKVAETSVKRYDAIGRLATSSLRASGEPLYRLIDPATGRTILYVRAAPGQSVTNVNEFVAINGKVVKDDQMKITYVEPTAIEPADAKQVNKKIFADYSPPSLAAANLAAGGEQN